MRFDAEFEHMGNVFRTHTVRVDVSTPEKSSTARFQTRPSALTRVNARSLHCWQWYSCTASTRVDARSLNEPSWFSARTDAFGGTLNVSRVGEVMRLGIHNVVSTPTIRRSIIMYRRESRNETLQSRGTYHIHSRFSVVILVKRSTTECR
jgi:hypothetical protein